MGMYRKEWSCCNSATETDAWEPQDCPFCAPQPQRTWVGLTEKDKEHLSDMSADPRWNAWIGKEQTEALLKENNT